MAANVKGLKLEDLIIASTEQTHQEDRLSNLLDDILSSILERLQLHEAVRTSILSRRWRHIFRFRSKIVIDIGAFHCKDDKGSILAHGDLAQRNAGVVKATKCMLAEPSQYPISLLRIKFHLMEDAIDIVRCVDSALATRKISSVHFLILSEVQDWRRPDDELVKNRTRFMRFFDAGPHAFASLSYLHIHRLMLSTDDVANMLSTCKKLERLVFLGCEGGTESVLKIEHPQLTTLSFVGCIFPKIELSWLPRLKCFTCYWAWLLSDVQCPLSFVYVPQLSTLKLTTQASIMHKTIRLSELLVNLTLSSLDLDFECERFGLSQKLQKCLVLYMFQNLQFLSLQRIHEECDLGWTMFFLEAAPLLKQIFIKVWDHTCYDSEQEPHDYEWYHKGYKLPTWEAPADLKHCNLKTLVIKGYQVEEKFTRYIRRVVEAAVNLEVIVLIHSGSCAHCEFSPSTKYRWTLEERLQIKEQILEWRSSPIKIGFESLESRPSQAK